MGEDFDSRRAMAEPKDAQLWEELPKHECQRCGSDEWTYVDYGGCSKCRPYEERIEESDG